MKEGIFKFKNICIFPETIYKEMILDFFINLKQKYNFEIYLVSATKDDAKYYETRYGNSIAKCLSSHNLLDNILEKREFSTQVILQKAQQIEKMFDTKIMHYVITDRHLGRGFSLGAPYFPRSVFSKKASYWKILNVIADQYIFLKNLFEENNVDLAIGGNKIVADVCRKLNIHQRYVAPYKYKKYSYWGVNEFWESNIFKKAFESSDCTIELNGNDFPTTYSHVINKAENQTSFKYALKDSLYLAARRFYWKARGYEKAKGYLLRDELTYTFRKWWRLKKFQKDFDVSINTVSQYDYIFFPLHLEPERATTSFSPEFFDQMFAILNISKELPAGKFLVIKEHLFSIPVRPKHFYRQLRERHNVLIANPFEKSFGYIKKARGVVALTGTAGFEAAMMGVPVLSFGQHNLYNILPHVHVVKSWIDISKIIEKIFRFDGENEKKGRIREGQRFINAFIKISANLGGDSGRRKENIYQELEKSLLMTIK